MAASGSAALLRQLVQSALEQSSEDPAVLQQAADQLTRFASERESVWRATQTRAVQPQAERVIAGYVGMRRGSSTVGSQTRPSVMTTQ